MEWRYKSRYLAACTLGLLMVWQAASAIPNPQQEAFQYMQERQYSKALECLNTALKEHPNDWQILQSIGNCHMHLGQNEAAINNLQKSIEIGGLHSTQCTIMAAALEGLGKPNKALSWLRLACSIDPVQAQNPAMQVAMQRLQDPAHNPSGSPTAPDYLAGLVAVNKWRKEDLPLKVYVRKNIQLPEFHQQFIGIVRDSLNQWCEATGNIVSYKFVDNKDSANLICDYTDRRELVASDGEPGLEGSTNRRVRTQDNTTDWANIVVLVKDAPTSSTFRADTLISTTFLHEAGHALGLHGHSPNKQDVMFLASTVQPVTKLSERDKNTIKRIYPR